MRFSLSFLFVLTAGVAWNAFLWSQFGAGFFIANMAMGFVLLLCMDSMFEGGDALGPVEAVFIWTLWLPCIVLGSPVGIYHGIRSYLSRL